MDTTVKMLVEVPHWLLDALRTLEKRYPEALNESDKAILTGKPYEEPKAEHWIHRNDDHNDWLECSGCGYGDEGEVKLGEETNYCPHCGAPMEVEK